MRRVDLCAHDIAEGKAEMSSHLPVFARPSAIALDDCVYLPQSESVEKFIACYSNLAHKQRVLLAGG